MRTLFKKLYDNSFVFIMGIVYYLSFSGMPIGDLYFRNLENGYPLFYKSIFTAWPTWLGFDVPHLLGIPILRLIQISISWIGLLPNPLLLVQLINLVLALGTLKLVYSILSRLNIHRYMAIFTVLFVGFSYAFFANMNGELHHFSVFLMVLVLSLLLDLEEKPNNWKRVFLFCFSLALIPLFHLENIIYCILIFLYVLFKKNSRENLLSNLRYVILGMLVLPVFLVIASFFFHYYELGSKGLDRYLVESSMIRRFLLDTSSMASSFSGFHLKRIYGVFRAYLESFSIISRMLSIIPSYKQFMFYSNGYFVNFSFVSMLIYLAAFLSVNFAMAFKIIKTWKKEISFIKLLIFMLISYLCFSFFAFEGIYLISEFFIVASIIFIALCGHYFNTSSNWMKSIFYFLAIFTIFTNVIFFVYPQKVSALSINRVFDDVEAKNQNVQKIDMFRVSFFDFPYEIGQRHKFNIFSDEHAYDSESDTLKYITLINGELRNGRKVYLIGPELLFYEDKNIDSRSMLGGEMNRDPNKIRNIKYFINRIMTRHKTTIEGKYPYNYGMYGQLIQLVVVELK